MSTTADAQDNLNSVPQNNGQRPTGSSNESDQDRRSMINLGSAVSRPEHLLDIDGLLKMARLIKGFNKGVRSESGDRKNLDIEEST
jgi:hypothetical protein